MCLCPAPLITIDGLWSRRMKHGAIEISVSAVCSWMSPFQRVVKGNKQFLARCVCRWASVAPHYW